MGDSTGDDSGTEQKILEAARRVFVRRGTAGARMQEIASVAGVNQALLHYYFKSKEGLADAVFRDLAGRLLPGVVGVISGEDSIETKVEMLVHLYIDLVRESPFIPGYVVAEVHQHPDRIARILERTTVSPEDVRNGLERLGAQLDSAATAGRIRPIAPLQFLSTMLGATVAPFLILPVMQHVLGMSEDEFESFLDARRTELPGFILAGLRP